MDVTQVGPVCFGVVIGYVTYRTITHKDTTSISDIAAVAAAIGGGVIAERFGDVQSQAFALYSIGLILGMAVFLVLHLALERDGSTVLGGDERSTVLGDDE